MYIKKLLQLHEITTWGDDGLIADCLTPLALHFNLSLRQLEKVFTNLAIIYSTSGEKHLRLVPIIVFVAVVKVFNPNLFSSLLLGQITFAALRVQLGLSELSHEEEDKHNLMWMLDWVRFSMLSKSEYEGVDENDPIRKYEQTLLRYNRDRKRILVYFCEKLSMFNVN